MTPLVVFASVRGKNNQNKARNWSNHGLCTKVVLSCVKLCFSCVKLCDGEQDRRMQVGEAEGSNVFREKDMDVRELVALEYSDSELEDDD